MSTAKSFSENYIFSNIDNTKSLEESLLNIQMFVNKLDYDSEVVSLDQDLDSILAEFWVEYGKRHDLQNISKKSLRKLPYVYFYKSNHHPSPQNNSNVHNQLLEHIKSRRGKNFTKSLYSQFLRYYDNVEEKEFFFTIFESFFQNDKRISSQNIFNAHRQFNLLSSSFFKTFSEKFFSETASLESMFLRLGIKENLIVSDFINETFIALNKSINSKSEATKLNSIASFYLQKKELVSFEVKKNFLCNILISFSKSGLTDPILSKNFDLLVNDTMKDPRKSPGTWIGLEDERRIYLGWKLSHTMNAFFDLIDKSCEKNEAAVRMWEPRKTILKALYDQGHIQEAWFYLGPQARKDKTKYLSEDFSDFGKLETFDNERTIILLKVGNHILAEGTYNYAFRIWKSSNSRAPRLYDESYAESRLMVGEDFKKPHSTDQWLKWMPKIINEHLGIKLKIK